MYNETSFTFGEYPLSQKFNSFNARIKASFELVSKALSTVLQNDTVLDSTNSAFDKVLFYDASGTSYTDRTLQAASTQTPYFPIVTVVSGDMLYFGFESTFSGITFTFSTPASATITPDWEYYNGTAFTDLTVTDNTGGFTSDGNVTWAVPGDWTIEDLNTILSVTNVDSVDRFWVRVQVGANQDFKIQQVIRNAAITSELKVIPTTTASMAIIVEPGLALVNEKLVSITSRTQLSVSAPSSDSRYTIIQLSDQAVLSIKEGTAAASPTPPAPDSNNIKLADILITSTTTSITTSEITDQRVFSSLTETLAVDKILTLTSGADYIFNLDDADSFVVIRDPNDSIQTQWFGQDGHGELFPSLNTVTAAQAVYYNTTNTQIELADATDNSKPCAGFVVRKPTSTTGVIANNGICKGFSGLSPGSDYYLSTTAGGITTTPPSSSGNIVQKVGRALSASILSVRIDAPVTIA